MRKGWLVFIMLVALIGAVVSGYSLNLYYQVQSVGFDKPSLCNLGPTMNCEVVMASAYAAIAKMPIAGLGMCFYIFSVLMAIAAWVVPTSNRAIANFGWVLGVGAFLYSAVLAYVSANILRVWCPTCIVMYAVNFLLWMSWWVGGSVHPLRVLHHFSALWKWSLALLAVTAIGAVFMLSKSQSIQRLTPVQIKDAIYAFERGSTYELPAEWSEHPVWGNPNAKVTIVEFSDFECPFCKVAALNLQPSLIDFRDDVRLVFVNYPLDQSCNKALSYKMHEHACQAAMGAMCAFEQGKFWGFSEDVFRDQRRVSSEMLIKIAEKHQLDVPAFTQCLDTQATLPKVMRDIDIAQQAQVHGTPAIFVNGKLLRSWRSPDVLRGVLNQELAKVK